MLGRDFARTLRAAQRGDDAAFMRLWRDGNAAMIRYLRVADVADPYLAAREGWLTVVRGLATFHGDETEWRLWILGCARMHTVRSPMRRSLAVWGSATGLPGLATGRPPETATPEDRGSAIDPVVNRGVNDTIDAIRDLPLGQGEILMLRLAGELTVAAVADVVGTDVVAVRRSEATAIERLGAERELLAWSLSAPPMSRELAGERAVLNAFRSVTKRLPAVPDTTRVIALGPARRSGAVSALGRSRTALVGIAAVSATMMSLGGLSAAAYVGALPDAVQQVMHVVIGAPAPGESTRARRPSASPTGAALTRTDPAVGLCRAWSADKAKGVGREKSTAYRRVAEVAGGSALVDAYCTIATHPQPRYSNTTPHPGASAQPTAPTQAKTPRPTPTSRTPKPSTTPSKQRASKPTSTRSPKVEATHTAAPHGATRPSSAAGSTSSAKGTTKTSQGKASATAR